MAALKSYRELTVWRKSIDWAERIYEASKRFAPDERFGLTSQIRRAAVSVPSNIAEGAARSGTGEFLQFLSVASGSLAEAETQLVLAHRLKMLPEAEYDTLMQAADELGRMLTKLKQSLRSKL